MYNAEDVEKVSSVIHDIWVEWSKYLCSEQYYDIPNHIRNHFALNWKPYNELSEAVKEKDRPFAKRIMEALER